MYAQECSRVTLLLRFRNKSLHKAIILYSKLIIAVSAVIQNNANRTVVLYLSIYLFVYFNVGLNVSIGHIFAVTECIDKQILYGCEKQA